MLNELGTPPVPHTFSEVTLCRSSLACVRAQFPFRNKVLLHPGLHLFHKESFVTLRQNIFLKSNLSYPLSPAYVVPTEE